MMILGIWDGHDAGAAIVDGEGKILAAVNEERLSRKKLDIGFPSRSVASCLSIANLTPSEITDIAVTTTDLAKTASRLVPAIGRNYYLFRRRKIDRPPFTFLRRSVKFTTTQVDRPRWLLRKVNEVHFSRILSRLGFRARIHLIDHHAAHAASAYYPSGMRDALCVTLDGVGDGLSGSVNVCESGTIKRISAIPASQSIGIFFEQVTTILGMRELEDEGKVMSLADYSHKKENRLAGFFKADGLKIRARYDPLTQYRLLERMAWRTPPEDFAKMAQDTLEATIIPLFRNAAKETGMRKVCWAGGIASNIKLNQLVRQELRPKDWFVFPHMGDGGLAAGAALIVAGVPAKRKLDNAYFGPSETRQSVIDAVKSRRNLKATEAKNPENLAADTIEDEQTYVFWFQGGMEFGPRALGNRSIIAPAASLDVKNELNLKIKSRNWYQPFCPSILEGEARKLFSDYDGVPDKFMTMGYACREGALKRMAAAIHVDGSARPQMVGKEAPRYGRLISRVKRRTGVGAVLNTSFNLHGDPIVCSINDALDMMERTRSPHLFAEGIHITIKERR
jgi:carbamoyltransferase